MYKLLAAGLLPAVILCCACNNGANPVSAKDSSSQALTLIPMPIEVEEEQESLASQKLTVTETISQDGVKDEMMGEPVLSDDSRGLASPPLTETYTRIVENRFQRVSDQPVSTFSIDVDAASYSNIRRMLDDGHLPPADAVRIEEMVNYFSYDYASPTDGHPFAIHTEVSEAPWNKKHKLVLVGLHGKKINTENLPPANLVFLIDVSGSMDEPDKLGLVKFSMGLLATKLRRNDKVSIVVYAGAAGVVLEPTSDKQKILAALDQLSAGGSTAGEAGLRLAYRTARKNFSRKGNNRVIICTDGDFNVGESSDEAMEKLIEKERESGVFLTVLGFGTGNYQDGKMQLLADKGNGNHAYIDGLPEAKKVLVTEFGGTLFTIAKDVKLQVEFNPAKVAGYRLIGYENRMLAKEDFNDDKTDAGELGSGHTVTALYEVIPAGVKSNFLEKPSVDPLKYATPAKSTGNGVNGGGKLAGLTANASSNELLTVKFRYKEPSGETSKLIVRPLLDENRSIAASSDNFRFAAAVAEFGMLLRDSEFKSAANFAQVKELGRSAKGPDEEGHRAGFLQMVEMASLLWRDKTVASAGSGINSSVTFVE